MEFTAYEGYGLLLSAIIVALVAAIFYIVGLIVGSGRGRKLEQERRDKINDMLFGDKPKPTERPADVNYCPMTITHVHAYAVVGRANDEGFNRIKCVACGRDDIEIAT